MKASKAEAVKVTAVKPTLSVIIPAFNEEETIKQCIDEVVQTFNQSDLDYEIIVVDDGSTDETFDRIKEAKKDIQGKIRIIHHSSNMEKGHSIMTGLTFATNDMILIQDADLEYSPREALKLMEPIFKGEADAVYGSRFLGGIDRMSLSHRFGNKVLTFVTNILYGCRLSDIMTGYKIFRKNVLNRIKIESVSFEFEVEITVKMLEHGFKILEMPALYTRRKKGRAKIKWIHGIRCLVWLLHHRFTYLSKCIKSGNNLMYSQ